MKICKRFGDSRVPRLPVYDLELGIKTKKKHYLAFTVDKPIILFGFGIYGTMTSEKVLVSYGLYRDDVCEMVNQKTLVEQCELPRRFDGHRRISTLKFADPLRLKAFHQYVLFLDVDSYQTYRGVSGMAKVVADGVRFTFRNEFDDISMSSILAGNFPEIYFDVWHDDD